MSHFASEQASRPTMRRKSSAQNLLSSFKGGGPTAVPPPLNLATQANTNSTTLSFAAAVTPTAATTPIPRDNWDAQSVHAESLAPSLGGAASPQLGQGTSVEYLRDLVQKRIITLTYVRSIHEGRSHWFHTILISQTELQKVFNNNAMKKRTYRFAILGLSLSSLLDINQPQDLLRGLLNTVTEYDQAKEEGDNKSSKMRIKFKGRNPKKGSMGEYYSESSGDASYMMTPSMPFPLDYHQTLLSLLDVLSEVYHKISKLLGPSPFSHSSQHMMGPLGLLSPQPGISYLFSEQQGLNGAATLGNPIHGHSNSNLHQPHQPPPSFALQGVGVDGDTSAAMSGSLWSIANPASSHGMQGMGSTLPVPVWSPLLGEMVLKIDGKLKKISTTLLKDLDTFARNAIRDELASLDPLLRNLGDAGSNKIMYEFEGI